MFKCVCVRLDLENFFAEMKEVQAADCKLLFVVFRDECNLTCRPKFSFDLMLIKTVIFHDKQTVYIKQQMFVFLCC